MKRSLVFSLIASGAIGCGGGSTHTESAPARRARPEGPSIVVTPAMGPVHVGTPAPDFELPDQNGQPVRLSSLRGSVVSLAFVTSWCPFSTAEQPHLKEVAAAYAGRNVRFLAVSLDETDEGYRQYVGRMDMGFPVLHDARAAVVGPSYIPPHPGVTFSERNRWKTIVSSNLVVDPEGVIRFFTLTDTLYFDAELRYARRTIDELLAAGRTASGSAAPAGT